MSTAAQILFTTGDSRDKIFSGGEVMPNKRLLRKLLIASLAAGSLVFAPEIYALPVSPAIVLSRNSERKPLNA